MNSRAWLAEVSWEMVVWQNEQLCKPKNAHHGPTSDGHAECKRLWEDTRSKTMTLDEMVELCRKCHRLAPFTNYNGNTFSAIARALIETLEIPKDSATISPAAWPATLWRVWPVKRR